MKRSQYAKLFESHYINNKKQDKKERKKEKKQLKREQEQRALEQQQLLQKQEKEKVVKLAIEKQQQEIDKVFNRVIKCACGGKIYFEKHHINDNTGTYIPLSFYKTHCCWNKEREKLSGLYSGLYVPAVPSKSENTNVAENGRTNSSKRV